MCNKGHVVFGSNVCVEADKAFVSAVVLESFGKGEAPGSISMPACIVLERWDYSLSDWNNKLQRQPDDVELKSALYMVRPRLCTKCFLSYFHLTCVFLNGQIHTVLRVSL